MSNNISVKNAKEVEEVSLSKTEGRGKAYRRKQEARIKRKYELLAEGYYAPVGYKGRWEKNSAGEYHLHFLPYTVRYSRPRAKSFLKKFSNSYVRHCSDIGNGNNYRKAFDLQWSLD